MKPIISIIVPVYNVKIYLRQCLNSIKKQTFKNWECILVDDGSTDGSQTICDEFSYLDSRFRVIHQPNGGLSSARNAALKVANGEYIGFVDSDDWIEPGMYDKLYSLITKYEADISMVGFVKELDGKHHVKHLVGHVMVMDRSTVMQDLGFDRLPNYVWNKLHRRSIITCGFPEGRNFEDVFVYGEWLNNVEKVVIDPTPLYHYRMRKGSIIHAESVKNRHDYFLSCIDRIKMMANLPDNHIDVAKINAYINQCAVNAVKIIARKGEDRASISKVTSEICDKLRQYPLPAMKYMYPKTWCRAWLLRHSPNLFCALMKWVHLFDIHSKYRNKFLFK